MRNSQLDVSSRMERRPTLHANMAEIQPFFGDRVITIKLLIYLGVIFDTGGTDEREIRSRVIQARKCTACLNGILWSKDIRKERKLKIYNVLIKSSLLYGSETWRLTENKLQRWMP